MNSETKIMLMAGGALMLLFFYVKGNAQGLAAGAVAGAVGIADDVLSGAVMGAGDVMGIPRTNQTECEKALAEGRTLDASFACPASDFLTGQWDRVFN